MGSEEAEKGAGRGLEGIQRHDFVTATLLL